jgi:L-lactate dehydrogenase complex protein LldE
MTESPPPSASKKPRVGLFVTCLVDLIRPAIGFAAVKLLEGAGCIVEVPSQTCCGQPAYNSGDRVAARAIASGIITAFKEFDYVVAPSGSCAGMIRVHLPLLFADDPNLVGEARDLASKTYELVSFLVDVMKVERVKERFDGTVTYHDSCAGLRELGVKAQPRLLLSTIEGLTLTELKDSDACCGFGGTFAVKYGDISDAIVSEKTGNVKASGAQTLLAGDLGCLMNMAGKLSRQGETIAVRHVAEVLAGMTGEPPIGVAVERTKSP